MVDVFDPAGEVHAAALSEYRLAVANGDNHIDEEYATRIRSTTPDGGGDPYIYWHLGTPRTLRIDYSFQFSLL